MLEKRASSDAFMLWMIVDGVGLAIIAAATVLDGVDLWELIFSSQWDYNKGSLSLWFAGRGLQVAGLFCLISHAATMQLFHLLEFIGMALLTAGPVLNLVSYSSMHIHNYEGSFVFMRKWLVSELLELIGILFLDLSMIDTKDYLVLLAEVIGFFILGVATMLELSFPSNDLSKVPIASWSKDPVHISDAVGLLLLTFVAIGQYNMKRHKHLLSTHYSLLPTTVHDHEHGGASSSPVREKRAALASSPGRNGVASYINGVVSHNGHSNGTSYENSGHSGKDTSKNGFKDVFHIPSNTHGAVKDTRQQAASNHKHSN